MANALEEFLSLKEGGQKKEAASPGAFGNFGQHLSHAAAGGIAAGAVGAGMAGIGMAASKILDAATKSRDFRAMLDANEDLREHHENDPKRFNMMFSTLRTMNPQFSKDPLVAGTFMRQMHASPEGIAGIAGEALKHRRDFGDSLADKAMPFAQSGAQAGLSESLKQRTPEQMFAAKKPEMDYSHQLQQQRDMVGHGLKAQEMGLKHKDYEQRERHHDQNMAEKLRASQMGEEIEEYGPASKDSGPYDAHILRGTTVKRRK